MKRSNIEYEDEVEIVKCGCLKGNHKGLTGIYLGTEIFRGKTFKIVNLGSNDCRALRIKELK
jgi:hypothetical protein